MKLEIDYINYKGWMKLLYKKSIMYDNDIAGAEYLCMA
jgi:hypothetical protein